MTSKLVVNTIEADTGISSVSFASSISMDSTSKFHFSAAGVDIGADTNINRPAAGVLAFNINSSEKVRITSGGKILIGTNTPQGNANADDLVVSTSGHSGITIRSGTSSNGNIFFADGTSGGDEYRGVIDYNHSSNHMSFSTNAVERLRIDSSGRVMIGTTTEGFATYGDQFTIANTGHCGMTIRSGTSNYGTIYFSDGDDGSADEVRGFVDYNHSTNMMQLGTNGSARLLITSTGKLQLSNSDGIQLSAQTSTLYAVDGTLSYYSTSNGVYLNGAGASGWLRLSAAGTANNRTAINIYGHSHASADQIDFRTNSTERLRIDSSGISKFMNFGGGQIHLGGGSAHSAKVTVTDNAGTGNGNFLFAGPSGEHLRITSGGNIGINNTSPAYKLDVAASGTVVSRFKQNTNSTAQTASCVLIRHAAALSGQDGVGMLFQNSGGSHIGRIDLGQSTTNYRTSSDYRLKENAVAISDGITRLKTLKPYRFNWIAEKDQPKVDGFFAHEVTAVPESISGAKDEIDSDNNPVYQSMDHSKLVPLLTAALQEAIAKIETLEAEVASLKSS